MPKSKIDNQNMPNKTPWTLHGVMEFIFLLSLLIEKTRLRHSHYEKAFTGLFVTTFDAKRL